MAAWCLTPVLVLALGAEEEPWPVHIFDTDTLERRPLSRSQPLPREPMLGTNPRALKEWSSPPKEAGDEYRNFGFTPSEEKPGAGLDVAELIRRLVAAGTWEDSGNRVDTVSRRLEVRHEPQTVEEVERLLTALKVRQARTLTLELALVPPPAMDTAVPGWRRPGAVPWLDGDAMDRVVIAGAEGVEYASEISSPGFPAFFMPRAKSLRVIDHEANQTGTLPVSNQVVSAVIEGLFAKVLATPLPDGRRFRVDARVGRRRPAARPERRRLHFGEVDLLSELQEDLSVVTVLSSGRTAVLGSLAMNSDESWVVLLRISSSWEREAEKPGEGLPLMLDIQALNDGLPQFESGRKWDSHAGLTVDSTPFELDPVLLSFLGPESGNVYTTRDTLFLSSASPAAATALERLSALARERLPLFKLEVVEALMDREAAASLGAEPDIAWFENTTGARVRIACVSRARFSIASARTRSYVADIEMVSGGTGNEIVEIGDPVMGVAGEGLVLRGTVEGQADASSVLLKLEGERTGPARWRQSRARVSYQQDLRLKEGSHDELEPIESDILLDLPEMEVQRLDQSLRIPLEKPVLLRIRPDPEKPGTSRALVVMVTAISLLDR